MPDLSLIVIGIIVIAILWLVIKFIFKLTMKIFSCGIVLIVIIGAVLFFAGYFG